MIKLLALLLLTSICFAADEKIVDFEENSVPVLNEELRKIDFNMEEGDLWEDSDGDIVLKSADDIDVQGKQIKGMVIENRTDDTGCTQTGRIWFRTDI